MVWVPQKASSVDNAAVAEVDQCKIANGRRKEGHSLWVSCGWFVRRCAAVGPPDDFEKEGGAIVDCRFFSVSLGCRF